MAQGTIMVDTSVLIDFYRKTDKNNSAWILLIRQGYSFAVSAITRYEIYSGANEKQLAFWNEVFGELTLISLNEEAINKAIDVNAVLKRKRKQIDMADLFIAATAMANNLSLATLNVKHFDRIEVLTIIG